MRRFCKVRNLCAIVVLVGISALGQTRSDEDVLSLDIAELGKVKVYSASRRLEQTSVAPSSVSVITAEEIRRYGWRTLGEVLRSLRGFYTSYDRSYTYLGVRGFQRPGDYNSRVLLLLNGHRLNENVYGSAFLGTEFPLDLDLIDRIEVVRGPGSSLFGNNAIFGVVNVITRRPTNPYEVEVSADVASFLSRSGRISASATRGHVSGLVSGSLYESAGQSRLYFPELSSSNGGIAQNIDGDRYAHLFSDLQYGNLRLQGFYGSRRKIIPTADYETNFGDPGTRITDTVAQFDTDYKRSLSDKTDVEIRAFYQHYNYDGTYAYGGTNSPDRYLNYDSSVADWAGLDAMLDHRVGRHHMIIGANYEYSFRVDQQNYDAGQPFVLNDHRTPWLTATYGELALELGHNLKLHAGARFDYFDVYGAAFSPRAALVYAPGTKTSIKYIFGRAFRAPNAYENYYMDRISTERPLWPLQKENIQSHELVFERNLTPWLGATLDGYYNNLDKLIDWVPNPANAMTHAANIGQDHGRGVEIELNAKWRSGWQGRASYSVADAHDPVNRQRLDNSPLHQTKLNAIIPVTRHAFGGIELLYSSAQQSYHQTRVSPSFLSNLTLSTKPFWSGFELSASCYNATNRRWFSPSPPSTTEPAILQDGRTFRFKLSYHFSKDDSRGVP
jgi:outer membrane receptor for ferrienterochelin and colicins